MDRARCINYWWLITTSCPDIYRIIKAVQDTALTSAATGKHIFLFLPFPSVLMAFRFPGGNGRSLAHGHIAGGSEMEGELGSALQTGLGSSIPPLGHGGITALG